GPVAPADPPRAPRVGERSTTALSPLPLPRPFPRGCPAPPACSPGTTRPSRDAPTRGAAPPPPPTRTFPTRRGRRWRSRATSRSPLPPSPFPDAPQIREEPGIADGDRGSFREPHVRPRYCAEHRERHREPVVARRLDPPARRPGCPLHVQIVATGLGIDTQRAQ